MKIFHNIADYKSWRKQQQTIAFVPTMGNLHAGHISLVNKGFEYADKVVVSIFVNPLQFAPHEDFASYPRTLNEDCEKLAAANVSAVFAPNVNEMYPQGQTAQTQILVPAVSQGLCGASRPHFFQGVATVVCKLFQIIQAEYAVFGEKDYQQLLVIKKMVQDLAMPIQVIGAPLVRESNGLAMSSRNQYLSVTEKQQAGLLYQSLIRAAAAIGAGENIADVLIYEKHALTNAGFILDYYEARDAVSLAPLTELRANSRLFVAAFLGKTRLIDNVVVPALLSLR